MKVDGINHSGLESMVCGPVAPEWQMKRITVIRFTHAG
jgi:hypothetical protein